MEPVQIPQHLDEPERILLFTPDEFILLIVVVGFGFVFKMFFGAIIAGFVAFRAYSKFKAGFSLRRLLARLYWAAPVRMIGLRRSPDAIIREWVG